MHIDFRYHFLQTDKKVKVKKIGITDNPADFFTKSISFNKFKHCLDLLNSDYYVM